MRVLVTCGDLTNGGVQRSLISFLGLISESVEGGVVLVPSLDAPLVAEVPAKFKAVALPRSLRAVQRAALTLPGIFAAARHPLRAIHAASVVLKYLISDRERAAKLFRESYAAASMRQFGKLRLGMRPDLVIQYAGGQGIWDSLVLAAFPGTPKVVWIHGDIARFGSGTPRQRGLLASYDAAVTVSPHGKEQLVEAVPELEGRTRVVENHLDTERILSLSRAAVDDVAFTVPTLCSVTRLTQGKAIDVGVRAARLLADRGVVFQWLLIGDGAERQHIERLVKDLRLEANVLVLGWRSNPHKYVARSDVFVHTSKSEGKSVAIAEAMALEKPVIVTRYPSVGDQITHGTTGLISELSPGELADAIQLLLTDGSLRRNLADNVGSLELRGTSSAELTQLIRSIAYKRGT